MSVAYRIMAGRPRGAAPRAPSDTARNDAVPVPAPAGQHAESITAPRRAQRKGARLHGDEKSKDTTAAAAGARPPRRSASPARSSGGGGNPPAWWERKQDGVGISSPYGRPGWRWRQRLVDAIWSAGPLCWASLAAFVVLNLAVLACEGPRHAAYLCNGLLLVAVAIPLPMLGVRWWQ